MRDSMMDSQPTGVKFGNPIASSEQYESVGGGAGLRGLRTTSEASGGSSRGWLAPVSVAREPAQDHELEELYQLLRDTAEYLASLTEQTGWADGAKFRDGIPLKDFNAAMQHMGLILSSHECNDMFVSADASGDASDGLLQLEEFMEMTAGASCSHSLLPHDTTAAARDEPLLCSRCRSLCPSPSAASRSYAASSC